MYVKLHSSGPGFRQTYDTDLKHSSVGQNLMLAYGWAHHGLTGGFFLAQTASELWAPFPSFLTVW